MKSIADVIGNVTGPDGGKRQPKRTVRCDTCHLDKPVAGATYPTCDDCLLAKGFVRGKWGWYQPGGAK